MKKLKICCILASIFLVCAGVTYGVRTFINKSAGDGTEEQSDNKSAEELNKDNGKSTGGNDESQDESEEETVDVSNIDNESSKKDKVDEKAEEILDGMTLEEKVGQLFIVRYPSDDIAAKEAKAYGFGGYILFGKDFENASAESVIQKIASCQEASKIPMLIGVDEEGGTVNRVSRYSQFRGEPFKSPQQLYAEGGYDLIEADTVEKCALLKSLGINLNLAPVCDISVSPEDFIYKRSFGRSSEETSEYIRTVVSIMNENNMGCVLKHFPGYGNNSDTHTGIAYDDRDYSTFEKEDFFPFKAGIDEGAGAILVSHNIVKCMDGSYPASLSENVHKILRDELGFNGVIMTDDLSMEAISGYVDENEAAVLAITSGNDMVCCTDYSVQIPAVIDAVKSGRISEDRINESAIRILKWKIKLGIIK